MNQLPIPIRTLFIIWETVEPADSQFNLQDFFEPTGNVQIARKFIKIYQDLLNIGNNKEYFSDVPSNPGKMVLVLKSHGKIMKSEGKDRIKVGFKSNQTVSLLQVVKYLFLYYGYSRIDCLILFVCWSGAMQIRKAISDHLKAFKLDHAFLGIVYPQGYPINQMTDVMQIVRDNILEQNWIDNVMSELNGRYNEDPYYHKMRINYIERGMDQYSVIARKDMPELNAMEEEFPQIVEKKKKPEDLLNFSRFMNCEVQVPIDDTTIQNQPPLPIEIQQNLDEKIGILFYKYAADVIETIAQLNKPNPTIFLSESLEKSKNLMEIDTSNQNFGQMFGAAIQKGKEFQNQLEGQYFELFTQKGINNSSFFIRTNSK